MVIEVSTLFVYRVSSSWFVIPMFTILDSTITRGAVVLLESILLGHSLGAQILQEMLVVVNSCLQGL